MESTSSPKAATVYSLKLSKIRALGIERIEVMCPYCREWIAISKMIAGQAHCCPRCGNVFIETEDRAKRGVLVEGIRNRSTES